MYVQILRLVLVATQGFLWSWWAGRPLWPQHGRFLWSWWAGRPLWPQHAGLSQQWPPDGSWGCRALGVQLAVVHTLRRPVARGIFPAQGPHPVSPALAAESLPLSHPGGPTAVLLCRRRSERTQATEAPAPEGPPAFASPVFLSSLAPVPARASSGGIHGGPERRSLTHWAAQRGVEPMSS